MFLELNVTTRGTVGRGRKFARCEKECYKLVRTRHSCGDRMRKSLVIQLASLLIAAAIFVLGSSFPASSGSEGAAPTAQTARRQSAAQTAPPSARDFAGPPIVGQGPLARLLTASGRANPLEILVDSQCFDPCPAGTLGTPPNCTCPPGQDWDNAARLAKIGRNARAAWSAPRPTVNARLIPF